MPAVKDRKSTSLNNATSCAIIAQAVSRRVPVQLSALHAFDTVVWRGTVVDADSDSLVLSSVDPRGEHPQEWFGVLLRATLCVANWPYAFHTRLLPGAGRALSGLVCVEPPATIELIERRRAVRRRFRKSTSVQLHFAGDARNPIESTLLNLSARGLACRVDAHWTQILTPGAPVAVRFELDAPGDLFELDARVASATPNGEDDLVLGLEFVADQEQSKDLTRLMTVLKSK